MPSTSAVTARTSSHRTGDPMPARRPATITFAAHASAALEVDDAFEARPTPARELNDPGRFAAGLVRSTLEVLECERPLGQLMRWVDHDIYQSLSRRVAIRSRQPRSRARNLVVIRSVRVCEVGASAVEVSVVAGHGQRVRAAALRLEALDHRWRCTALEIGS